MSTATISTPFPNTNVTSLVDRRLLQRRRTRHDARMYAVRLTASGQSALKGAEPVARKTDEKLLAALSAGERDSFLKLLSRIVVQLQETDAGRGKAGAEK